MLQPPRSRPENARIQASSGSQFLVNSSSNALWHASETRKPQQDSSPNLPKPSPVKLPNVAFCRPKETERWCNVTTNKRWCNHQDQGPKTRGFKPQAEANSSSKGLVEHASETGEPQQDSSPNLPKPCAVKLPNVAFWRPKETERWCNATTNKRWCNHQDQGPKNARTEASSGTNSSSKGSVGHASETGKPQQDSSPNLPKPSPVKLPNVAFWRPKETERWCNATTNKRCCNHQDQGPKTRGFKPQAEANSSSKGFCGARIRNRETPARFKPKPAKTIPRKTA